MVQNDISHLQFIESMSTHLIKFNRRKFQQLKNTYAVDVASGEKILNDMTLPSFDSKMSHQRSAEIFSSLRHYNPKKYFS